MITPTADSCPRESFLMRRFIGSWKSSIRRSASSWSQFGKNSRAVAKACLGRASSGYFWLSRTKHMRCSTLAFSYGCWPKIRTSPLVAKFCAVRIDITVVLPAPLRPSSP